MGSPTQMTLFYFKSDGAIYSYCSGDQGMDHFAEHEADYRLMLDRAVVPYEDHIMSNIANYAVNTTTQNVVLSSAGETLLTKYQDPEAASLIREEIRAELQAEMLVDTPIKMPTEMLR